jgi:hypothetical protein
MNKAFNLYFFGFHFPAKSRLSCLRLNGIKTLFLVRFLNYLGYFYRCSCIIYSDKCIYGSFVLVLFPDSLSSTQMSIKFPLMFFKALETLVSVTTLPKGIALLNATWFYGCGNHNSRNVSSQLYLARSIRATSSPEVIQRICFTGNLNQSR